MTTEAASVPALGAFASLYDKFPSLWAKRFMVNERGQALDFANRPHQPDILDDPSHHIVGRKGNQVGWTLMAFATCMWSTVVQNYHTIFYFPIQQKGASRFSKTVAEPIMGRCDPILKILEEDKSREARVIGGGRAASIAIKQVGDAMIYFEGIAGKMSIEQIAANRLFFDERDQMSASIVRQARMRLAGQAAEHRYVWEMSIPTYPGYGIDEVFQSSDRKFWHVDCRCSDGIALSPAWLEHGADSVIGRGKLNGRTHWYRCPVCQAEPLDVKKGRWIRHGSDDARISGYHLSQLLSATREPEEIWLDWISMQARPQEFYNRVLGMPYQTADAIPSRPEHFRHAQLLGGHLSWARAMAPAEMSERQFCAGIDIMKRECYVVVKYREAGSPMLVLADLHVATGDDPLEEALRWLNRYPESTQIVIDANPLGSAQRRAALSDSAHRALAEYGTGARWAEFVPAKYDTKKGSREPPKFKMNRNLSIEESAGRIATGQERHPSEGGAPREKLLGRGMQNLYNVYREHMMGVVKKKEIAAGGRVRVRYDDLKENVDPHFLHANNYANAAALRGESEFAGIRWLPRF